jgi:hypothetical protein
MGGAYSTDGLVRNANIILFEKPEGKIPLGRYTHVDIRIILK